MGDGGNHLILGILGIDLFFAALLWDTEPQAGEGMLVDTACASGVEKFMVKLTGFWCIPLLHEIFMVV